MCKNMTCKYDENIISIVLNVISCTSNVFSSLHKCSYIYVYFISIAFAVYTLWNVEIHDRM